MTTAELADKIPAKYQESAMLVLSTVLAVANALGPKVQEFQYEPELFSDPKYYPEANRE